MRTIQTACAEMFFQLEISLKSRWLPYLAPGNDKMHEQRAMLNAKYTHTHAHTVMTLHFILRFSLFASIILSFSLIYHVSNILNIEHCMHVGKSPILDKFHLQVDRLFGVFNGETMNSRSNCVLWSQCSHLWANFQQTSDIYVFLLTIAANVRTVCMCAVCVCSDVRVQRTSDHTHAAHTHTHNQYSDVWFSKSLLICSIRLKTWIY